MSFSNQKISQFLDELSAKKATPGGGTASALGGAIAAALVLMVIEFTLGKEQHQKDEKKLNDFKKKAAGLKKALLALADQDAQAYLEVVKSKNSQEAIIKAAEVPLKTAQKSVEVIRMAAWLADHGNQNLRSDAFVALELGQASAYGALENVRINLASVKDQEAVEQIISQVNEVIDEVRKLAEP